VGGILHPELLCFGLIINSFDKGFALVSQRDAAPTQKPTNQPTNHPVGAPTAKRPRGDEFVAKTNS